MMLLPIEEREVSQVIKSESSEMNRRKCTDKNGKGEVNFLQET